MGSIYTFEDTPYYDYYLDFAYAPEAWASGNGYLAKQSGNFPCYPTGKYDLGMVGFSGVQGYSPSGFVYTQNFNDPSGGPRIETNKIYDIDLTDSFTIEIKFTYTQKNSTTWISAVDDVDHRFLFYVSGPNHLKFYNKNGGSTSFGESDTELTDGVHVIHFRKNQGAACKYYIDGVETGIVTSSSLNGNNTYTSPLIIGGYNTFGANTSGYMHWFAWHNNAMPNAWISGNAEYLLNNSFYGLNQYDSDNMVLVSVSGVSGDPAQALPTMGYGAGSYDTSLSAFGYGGAEEETIWASGSYYAPTGKKIVPASRQNSGPVILSSGSLADSSYLGKYYLTVVAEDVNGKPLEGVQWQFYAENIAAISGVTPLFSVHPQTTTIPTDKYGRAKGLITVSGNVGLTDFYDKLGTSGQYISMWATGDSDYITQRIDLEYRVI